MFRADDLFELDQTMAAALFGSTVFAWEAIPKIAGFIQELSRSLSSEFERIAENVWAGKGTIIDPSVTIIGPAIIGFDCRIRHTAYIRENVIIGHESIVGNSTELKNAILFNNVQVPHFNYVGDSILGYRAHLGAGVILSNVKSFKDTIKVKAPGGAGSIETGLHKFGALIGDNVEVGCNAVLNPGTIVGKNSIIYPLTAARGYIPPERILKNQGELVVREPSESSG